MSEDEERMTDEEVFEELSEGEKKELRNLDAYERQSFLDDVRFLIRDGTRERKVPKASKEELRKQLGGAQRELQKTDWAWRYQYKRAQELAKEKEKRDKKEEIEKEFGKGTVALIGHPHRSKKVLHLKEEEEEE